nr:hypothetical protein CFP56_52555 [Quercus suber]
MKGRLQKRLLYFFAAAASASFFACATPDFVSISTLGERGNLRGPLPGSHSRLRMQYDQDTHQPVASAT